MSQKAHTHPKKTDNINTTITFSLILEDMSSSASRHKREHSKTLALSTTVTWKSFEKTPIHPEVFG